MQAYPDLSTVTAPRPAPPVPYFFTLSESDTIERVLGHPNNWFIEVGEHALVQNQMFALLSRAPDFAVNITTKNAYQHTLALAISDNIHLRFGIQKCHTMKIHTCIQEAALNAVIHGNLEIESRFDTLKGLEDHYMNIQKRLTMQPYCDRRITIATWLTQEGDIKIAISDQGNGFSLEDAPEGSEKPHGRGLVMINLLADKVWVGEDRRTLWMLFTFNKKGKA